MAVHGSLVMHKFYSHSLLRRNINVNVRHVDETTGKHRVTLKMNQAGLIEEITCVPCGLLLLSADEAETITDSLRAIAGADFQNSYSINGFIQGTRSFFDEDDLANLMEVCQTLQRENNLAGKQIDILRTRLGSKALSQSTSFHRSNGFSLNEMSGMRENGHSALPNGGVNNPLGLWPSQDTMHSQQGREIGPDNFRMFSSIQECKSPPNEASSESISLTDPSRMFNRFPKSQTFDNTLTVKKSYTKATIEENPI